MVAPITEKKSRFEGFGGDLVKKLYELACLPSKKDETPYVIALQTMARSYRSTIESYVGIEIEAAIQAHLSDSPTNYALESDIERVIKNAPMDMNLKEPGSIRYIPDKRNYTLPRRRHSNKF